MCKKLLNAEDSLKRDPPGPSNDLGTLNLTIWLLRLLSKAASFHYSIALLEDVTRTVDC